MKIDTDSIKRLLTLAGEKCITKTGILKARTKYGSWERVAKYGFKDPIRKENIREIAKLLDIDTGKVIIPKVKVKPPIPIKPLKKPLTKIERRIAKAILERRKRIPWYRDRKDRTQRPLTKKGWWLTFRIQMGLTSPPYQPGEYWWEQRAKFIHENWRKPSVEYEAQKVRDSTKPDVRKGWFKLVWCAQSKVDAQKMLKDVR